MDRARPSGYLPQVTEAAITFQPIGGLGEVGMNALMISDGNTNLLIDCGITFDDRPFGINHVHPDFKQALDYWEKIDAIIITHGHEDHIGALGALFKHQKPPIFAPNYAARLIEYRQNEYPDELPISSLTRFTTGRRFQVGSFKITPYRVRHSIPDAHGLLLEAGGKRIIHSGDFRTGGDFEAERVASFAPIDLLLSDSTNIDRPFQHETETDVEETLREIADETKGALVIALFASNIERLASSMRAAQRTGRRVVGLGRSIHRHYECALAEGLLPKIPMEGPEILDRLSRDQICIVATGTQAEERAALARLANKRHPDFELRAGDTVAMSSRIIPGRELPIYEMWSKLERIGVEVIHPKNREKLHISGHAPRDEQSELIELCKPKHFIPLHGTFHHLRAHAALAEEYGANTLLMENGDIIELSDDVKKIDHRPMKAVLQSWGGPLADNALRTRMAIAESGLMILTLDGGLNSPCDYVQVDTRGMATIDGYDDIIDGLEVVLERFMQTKSYSNYNKLRRQLTREAQHYLRERTRARPWIEVIVLAEQVE